MIEIYTDGATVGHNGKLGTVSQVGLGVWIPALEREFGGRVSGISNNEAEFKALILGMKVAIKFGFKLVVFRSDSKIVVNRANGMKPKSSKFINERMDNFQNKVLELKKNFTLIDFEWIPREQNYKADEISKKYSIK